MKCVIKGFRVSIEVCICFISLYGVKVLLIVVLLMISVFCCYFIVVLSVLSKVLVVLILCKWGMLLKVFLFCLSSVVNKIGSVVFLVLEIVILFVSEVLFWIINWFMRRFWNYWGKINFCLCFYLVGVNVLIDIVWIVLFEIVDINGV